MSVVGKIIDYDMDKRVLIIHAPCPIEDWTRKKYEQADVDLHDGRFISPQQRGKIWALIADICLWAGYEFKYEGEGINEIFKNSFCALTGTAQFSLADCDMSTAREYINYLIDWVLANDVPCLDTILNRSDDINKTLYACLWYRKCAVCGIKAELHHVTTVGMGRDREDIVHVGMEAISLCREHHNKAHSLGKDTFNLLYHLYGVTIDEPLAEHLKLGKKLK